jgi:hypothetical protein
MSNFPDSGKSTYFQTFNALQFLIGLDTPHIILVSLSYKIIIPLCRYFLELVTRSNASVANNISTLTIFP